MVSGIRPIPTGNAGADRRSAKGARLSGHSFINPGIAPMKKALPEKMFVDDQSRLSALRNWVLDNQVTEIEMNERQFWNFAQLQPVAEKPWITFMGRLVRVPNMPEDAQKRLGVYDKERTGVI
jgi:hypothetical protein